MTKHTGFRAAVDGLAPRRFLTAAKSAAVSPTAFEEMTDVADPDFVVGQAVLRFAPRSAGTKRVVFKLVEFETQEGKGCEARPRTKNSNHHRTVQQRPGSGEFVIVRRRKSFQGRAVT